MQNDGWEEVSLEETNGKYIFSGKYPFSTNPNGKMLKDIFPDLTIKIEESENEYRYFTLDGKLDFTQLSESWNEVENVWAKEGLVSDSDNLIYKKGEVIFSAEEVQNLISTYGEPYVIIKVSLPGQTPVEASAAWDNSKDYMEGKTDTLQFTWTPDVRTITPIKAVRRIEPLTYVTETQAAAQINDIIKKYQSAIEEGHFPTDTGFSGYLNNWLLQPALDGAFTCSEYQQKVLLFLDKIRTDPDPEVRKLLDGLDYGPIDTNYEGHLAVVLYQRGTDWKTTGTVLDPWPSQKPLAFPIKEWADHIWGYDASSPNPDHESGQLYPHLTGGVPSYPAASEYKGDLSVEKLLAEPTKVLYIGSPVTPLLTMQDGRQVGVLPDGTFINQLGEGINFYSQPKGNGEYEWLFLLPDIDFTAQLHGLDDGEFHTFVGTVDGVYEYGGQPISDGGEVIIEVSQESSSPTLTLEDGSQVSPNLHTLQDIEQEPTKEKDVETYPGDEPSSESEFVTTERASKTNYTLIILTCCCCFSLLIAVTIVIVLILRRTKNK